MPRVYGLRVIRFLLTRGNLHSRNDPVTLHVNSSSSPIQTLDISEEDSVTAPETDSRDNSYNITG